MRSGARPGRVKPVPTRRVALAGSRVVLVASVSLTLTAMVLAVIAPDEAAELPGAGGVGLAIYEAVVYTVIAGLGASVTARQPRNPVGWLLQLIALALALNAVGNQIYVRQLTLQGEVTGFGAYATWSISWLWIFAIVPAFAVFPLLFPTGRPQSAPWWIVLWIALAAGAVMWFGTAFVPGPVEGYPAVVNPVGIDNPIIARLGWVGFGVLVPTTLAAIASVVIRFRRSTGIERQQLKWVAMAAALLPIAFSGFGAGSNDDALGFAILLTGLLLVAVAVAVAMLRYRLYDIDVVINRTLVYGALSGALAVTYLASVLMLQFVLRPWTETSELAVAGSTLAVAALFRPARTRIQAAVDRRFYRSRYDAARTLDAFTSGLRDQVDLDTVGSDLLEVARRTVHPTHASLWLRGVSAK
jgi:hypothetical protein